MAGIRITKTSGNPTNTGDISKGSACNLCRRSKDRPAVWMTVTFGLGYRKDSPRIDVATQPYPGRWTHHVMVGSAEEIDEELLGWIQEAAEVSAAKR